MNHIFLFTLAFLSFCFIGCNKQGSAETLDPSSVFKIENVKGQNMLDPETVGYFEHEKIRKYDLVNGEQKLYYQPNLDHPFGYNINKTSAEGFVMHISPNKESSHSPTTTYIDWGNGDKDTLVFAMTKNDGAHTVTTDIWYNGVSVYNTNNTPYVIKIVK